MARSCKRAAVAVNYADHLSDLPINILDYILERMPVRDAARTSILSSKWRYIWASHPNIILDKQFFADIISRQLAHGGDLLLTDIANGIFFRHVGPIVKVTLDLSATHSLLRPVNLDQWMVFLSRSGLMELTLDNTNREPYVLPSTVFSQKIEYVELSNCIFKPPTSFKGFNRLTKLSLQQVTFPSTISTYVLSTPKLEKLRLRFCIGIRNLNISAPAVKTFIYYQNDDFKLSCLTTGQSLTHVFLVVSNQQHASRDESLTLTNLFRNWPMISNLTLDASVLQYSSSGVIPEKLLNPVDSLRHLILLRIDFTNLDQIRGILCLLQSCPPLQTLETRAKYLRGITKKDEVLNYLAPANCMDLKLDRLQHVTVRFFTGIKAELLLVRLLLAHSSSLHKMSIAHKNLDNPKELRLLKELTRFPRASPKAEIIFEPEPQAVMVASENQVFLFLK